MRYNFINNRNEKQIKKDLKRQKYIQDKLECEFIIINDISH